MPLSDDDVREILRLIDESEVEELRVETERFSLYVRRGGDESAPAPAEPDSTVLPTIAASPEGGDRTAGCTRSRRRCSAPSTVPRRPVRRRSSTSVRASSRDTVVCLIEVMKMMNSVPAGVAGTIVEVCAENAQLVEDGAPLFQVRSDR